MAKAAAATTTNGFDPKIVQPLVKKIEGFFDDLDSERGTYMQKCRSIRESISAVYEEADARGIPKKELRAFVTARLKLEKARAVLDALEADQRETVEMLSEAFGDAADLPLFESRLRQAEREEARAQH
jgi:uncharacterized protein (UPF0335 family)